MIQIYVNIQNINFNVQFVLVLSPCYDKIPDKNRFKEERVYSGSWLEAMVLPGRKTWHWEHKVTGHIAFPVRKQRAMNAGAHLTLSFFISSHIPEQSSLHSQISRQHPSDIPRVVFLW